MYEKDDDRIRRGWRDDGPTLEERIEHRRQSRRFIPNLLTIKAERQDGQPPEETEMVPLGTSMEDLLAGQERERARLYEHWKKFRL